MSTYFTRRPNKIYWKSCWFILKESWVRIHLITDGINWKNFHSLFFGLRIVPIELSTQLFKKGRLNILSRTMATHQTHRFVFCLWNFTASFDHYFCPIRMHFSHWMERNCYLSGWTLAAGATPTNLRTPWCEDQRMLKKFAKKCNRNRLLSPLTVGSKIRLTARQLGVLEYVNCSTASNKISLVISLHPSNNWNLL